MCRRAALEAMKYRLKRRQGDDVDEDHEVSVADDDEHHGEVIYDEEGPSPVQCQQFYAMLKERCNAGLQAQLHARSKVERPIMDICSYKTPSSLPTVPPRSVPIFTPGKCSPTPGFTDSGGCPETTICSPSAAVGIGRRAVPRMGTRLDVTSSLPTSNCDNNRSAFPVFCRPEALHMSSLRLQDRDELLSESGALLSPSHVFRKGFTLVADTDSSPSSATTIIEKRFPVRQMETPSGQKSALLTPAEGSNTAVNTDSKRAEAYRQCGADVMLTNRANLLHTIALQQTLFQQQMACKSQKKATPLPTTLPSSSSSCSEIEQLLPAQFYLSGQPIPRGAKQVHVTRPTDLPLTTVTFSTQHQQQQQQSGNGSAPAVTKGKNSCSSSNSTSTAAVAAGETEVKMEWVVKRRSDGTRYVTRRPVKTSSNSAGSGSRRHPKPPPPSSGTVRDTRPKQRCRAAAEQRWAVAAANSRREVACSTDDDDGSSTAMSELKIGRYWTREQRRQHVEQRRERDALKQQRRAEAAAKAAAVRHAVATEEAPADDVHSTSAAQRHRNGMAAMTAFDAFMSVDEMMARGSRGTSGRYYYDQGLMHQKQKQLLSVTTV